MPLFRSIRSRLVALVIAVVLPGSLVLLWIFTEQFRRLDGGARHSALRIARSIANDVESGDKRSRAFLARMATRPKIQRADGKDCDSLFAIVDFFPQYLDLVLYDVNGNRVCSATPQRRDEAAAAIADDAAVAYLKKQGDTSRGLIVGEGGRWIEVVFHDVRDGATRSGVLALVEYLDLDVSAFRRGTVANILDEQGIVLARTGGSGRWAGRDMRNSILGRFALSRNEGRTEAEGVDHVVRQYGVKRIAGTNWTVVVGVPAGVVMADVRSLAWRGVAAAAVIALIVIVLALRIARTIEEPLEQLAQAAQQVGRVGYAGQVPAGGPRETAVVASAFNQMVAIRRAADEALMQSRAELQALSQKLLDVLEQERERIAREIHDELGQLPTAIKMDLGGLLASVDDADPRHAMMAERVRVALSQMLVSVQRISAELRPAALDDFGLLAAIESELRAFEQRTGIECELSLPGREIDVDRDTEMAIYRIVQEALTNVARHANARRVELRMREQTGQLVVDLCDDGGGVRESALTSRASLGILGMRERARGAGATMEITGVPGSGTRVSVRVPLKSAALA